MNVNSIHNQYIRKCDRTEDNSVQVNVVSKTDDIKQVLNQNKPKKNVKMLPTSIDANSCVLPSSYNNTLPTRVYFGRNHVRNDTVTQLEHNLNRIVDNYLCWKNIECSKVQHAENVKNENALVLPKKSECEGLNDTVFQKMLGNNVNDVDVQELQMSQSNEQVNTSCVPDNNVLTVFPIVHSADNDSSRSQVQHTISQDLGRYNTPPKVPLNVLTNNDLLEEVENERNIFENIDFVPRLVETQFAPYVEVKYGDNKVLALVDSGSDVCLLSHAEWKRINSCISSPKLRSEDSLVLQDFVGTKRKNVLGVGIVPLQIDDYEFFLECLVVSVLAENLVLGNNFLCFYKAKIAFDVEQLILNLPDGELTIPLRKRTVAKEKTMCENISNASNIVHVVNVYSRMKVEPICSQSYVKDDIVVNNQKKKIVSKNFVDVYKGDSYYQDVVKTKGHCTYYEDVNVCDISVTTVQSNSNLSEFLAGRTTLMSVNHVKSDSKLDSVCDISNDVIHAPLNEDVNFPSHLYATREEIFEICQKSPVLTTDEINQMYALLLQFRPVFAKFPGLCRNFVFKAEVDTDQPLVSKNYPVPIQYRDKVREEIQNMLVNDIIEPAASKHLMPLVVVKKPNGKIRLCFDGRLYAKHTVVPNVHVEKISDLLQKFRGKKYISSYDIFAAFWQISLDESCRDHLAFTFEGKMYRPKRVMYGAKWGVSALNMCLDKLFDISFDGKLVKYVDDLCLTSETFEQHLSDTYDVLRKILESGMTLNIDKAQVVAEKLKFLGHYVNSEYVESDPDNVTSLLNIRPPTNVKELKSLLGALQWHNSIIPSFAVICKCMFDLLKSGKKWKWGKEHEESLNTVKTLIAQQVRLFHPRLDLPFIIETDASIQGIASVLYQEVDGKKQVVAYASRVLRKHELNYTISELELLSIVWSLQKWETYVKGTKCLIRTDHKSLIYIQHMYNSNSRLMRWALYLQQFCLEYEYIPGKSNVLSDYLSRHFPEKEPMIVNTNFLKSVPNDLMNITVDQWKQEQRKDYELLEIIQYLELNDFNVSLAELPSRARNWKKYFALHQDLLVVKNFHNEETFRMYVPKQLVPKLFIEFHDNYGHFGSDKTASIISTCFYIKNLHQRVKIYIQDCIECQKSKPNTHPVAQLLKTVPSRGLRYLISVDLVGPLTPGPKQERYLLVVSDVYSRYVVAYCLRTATAITVTRCLIDQYFKHLGIPINIICDNGGQFVAKYFVQSMQDYGIKIHYVTPYNARASVVERTNRELKRLLRVFCHTKHNDWPKYVSECVLLLNYSICSSLGHAPCELHLNIKPTFGILEQFHLLDSSSSNFQEYLDMWKDKLIMVQAKRSEMIKERNEKANKNQENRKKLKAGDLVFLRSQQLSNAVEQKVAKLCFLYKGPVLVVKVINDNVVQLYDICPWRNLGLQCTGRVKLWSPSDKLRKEWIDKVLCNISDVLFQGILNGKGLPEG